jgi:CRP/FNR family transcriptional regulator
MEVKLAPGEFLLREKTKCESLFVIKEGQLEVYRTSAQGEKILIGMVSSGEYVGETALFKGSMNSSNVVALTPVLAIRFTKAAIEAQLKGVPTWLTALTRGLIERLHKTNEMMLRNGLVDETLVSKVAAIAEKFPRAEAPAAEATPDEKQKKTAS